jgi:hypothetical protein
VIRGAGVSAVVGGLIFAARIHPPDTLAAVTTTEWFVVHAVGVAMCFMIMLGITGIYARQAERAGVLGLVGFLALEVMWLITAAFQFVEAFVWPLIATTSPVFVEGAVGISANAPSAADLGLLPTLFSIASVLYLLGGLLLGAATYRAGILPRWAGAAFAIGTVAPLAFALLPHEFIRVAAVPFGLALACLGVSLWSDRPAPAARRVSQPTAQLRQAAAE